MNVERAVPSESAQFAIKMQNKSKTKNKNDVFAL